MTKTTKTIWKSVVFAGAMLGTPIGVAEADTKPGVTDAQPQMDLIKINTQIEFVTSEVAAAKTDADRKAAQAKLDKLRAEKAALEAKIAAAKATNATPPRGVTSPEIEKLKAERTDLLMKLEPSRKAVAAAQTQADRDAAKAKLEALEKDIARLDTKIQYEQLALERDAIDKATTSGPVPKTEKPAMSPSRVELNRATAERTALDPKISAAVDAVVAAQNDADRAAAKKTLVRLQVEKAALDKKIAELDAKVAKEERDAATRPRTPPEGKKRPKGRGFVLA